MVKPARRSASQMAREPLAGERRIATILVVDVWHSTDLLERVGTEDWVEIMNQLLQLLESKVHHFGGEVDQFRGDGLIAFFGATSAHEDDPERAILAALWMQKAVKTYAAELEERYDVDLRIRVGINTGEVIVTSVGNQEYREDTAMGEAITIAARMESAAEAGTVLVSENTYRLARSQFEWESLGEIRVKGVSEPLHVYRPVAPHADAMWSQGMYSYGFAIPLIGRQHEFRILKTCIEDLYDGRGGIAMVTGDKGSGKSFLVAHVRQYFERQGMLFAEAQSRDVNPSPADAANAAPSCPPRVTWLRGRCRSYDQSWPYTVWVDLLQDWLGMRYTEPMQVGRSPDLHKEEIAARLRQRSEALWGAQFTEYYPSLATFLSLPLEEEFQERVRHLSAEGVQRQFFLAARSWVEALGKRGPLVLTFADMHWADTSSLELLTHCLPLCDTEPLLWLLVFRPDRASPVWSFHHYLETEYPHRLSALSIPPLTEEQSVEFISRLIGAGTLPQETLQLVVRKAEGNPYYIKELVNALVAQGVLIHDPETGQWQSTRPVTTLDLPDSLQNLLLARIDRLAAEERQVLQVASVVGTVFWWNVLHSMVNGITDGPAKLKDYLTVLQRRQLIHERRRVPELGREYAFNSSLIRDVAYDSLLRSQREAYHRQAADYLEGLLASVEGLTSSTAPQRYGMVAYHYEQAGALDKALVYTLKAAKQAETFYANTEALGHYHHALELLDELAARIPAAPAGDESAEEARRELLRQRFEVLNHRRAVYYLLGELESGRADARAMLDLARQLEDHPELLVDALLEQPGVGNVQGREELEAGIEMARQALEIARSLGDRHREMRCLMALGGLYNLSKDPAWQDVGHQALELARELGDQRAEVKLLLGLGRAYGTDNFERSMEYFEAALPIVHELDDKSAEISLLSAMRMPLERSGDYYRMLVEYERKRLRISREIGDHYAEAHALMLCGQIEGLWLGDYEAGLELEYESLEFYSGITSSVYPLLRIAQMEVDLGRTEAALAALARAYPIGEQAVRDIGRAGLGLVRAIVYNACGDEAHLQMALEAAEGVRWMVDEQLVSEQYRIAALCEASAAHLGLAAVLVDAGACQHHREAALTLSRAAVDIYENFGFMQIVECSSEEALFRHSMALSINGQIEAAHDFLKRAYDEMMRKHAMIPPDSHYRQTFLNNIPIHRNIRIAYATSSMQLTWDGSKIQLRFDER
ncbi:MAG: ATP-binding protein [Anaerolineales bacterium]